MIQPSLRDWVVFVIPPGVETPGYCQLSLRDNAPASQAQTTHLSSPAFQHRFDAPGTDRRMLGVRTNIGFPMPAAFAFLSSGLAHQNSDRAFTRGLDFQLGDI